MNGIEKFQERASKAIARGKKPTEHPIEDAYVRYARSRGCTAKKLVEKGKRHFLDRTTFCPGGRTLIIEFKRPGKDATPNQQKRIEELRALGFSVYVCDQEGQAEAILDDFLEGLA